MYLQSAKRVNAKWELSFKHQIVVCAQLILVHHCPRDEHGLLLAWKAALKHISIEIKDNAMLGVIRMEMRNAMAFVPLYINVDFDAIKHTDNRHGEHFFQIYRIIKV